MHWGLLKAVFGGWFQSVILSLYSNPPARVLTDGTPSKPFGISNGTKDAYSPLIFALLMEPLAARISVDKCISGIVHNDMEHKISLFAYVMLLITNPASDPRLTLPI